MKCEGETCFITNHDGGGEGVGDWKLRLGKANAEKRGKLTQLNKRATAKSPAKKNKGDIIKNPPCFSYSNLK